MSYQRVILLGRLGKDPELKTVGENKAVVNFTMATSEKYGGEEKTTWHNITAWAKTAEVIAEHCHKGDMILIEGRLSNETYEKDGVTKTVTKITADKFSFAGGGGKKEADDAPAPVKTKKDKDGDLPF